MENSLLIGHGKATDRHHKLNQFMKINMYSVYSAPQYIKTIVPKVN